jgi:hypothetical protein
MKPLTLLCLSLVLIALISCRQNSSKAAISKKQEVPKPLQDNNKDFSLITKSRGESNMIDAIYYDLVKKQADLKKLEDQIEHFNAGKPDSLQEFDNYDSKSNGYYTSANETVDRIKDTILRQRLRILLTSSQRNYRAKTLRLKSLIAKTELEQLTMADYYLTLKLAATLPIIEDYQNSNMPDGKSITEITNESARLNKQTQKLAQTYESKASKN